MKTVTLDILNEEAINLLKNLEVLKLIRFRKDKEVTKSIKKVNIYDFVGIISKQDALKMSEAITEACETIDENDWK
ncbi:hypothetical protein [uncultured Pedobacter sp.]|uniref:hypothetical protein n=1 Tax=uncultured Pedobacter sp. TaxID=246139 RepID=UPI00262C8E18|nr:hypothetical protein [uncultured Pedobacter sp.]